MAQRTFTITEPSGLHARPATLLVNTASQYASDVQLSYQGKTVNLKSILGVLSLGIQGGSEITITAKGTDEEELLEALANTLKTENLGE